MFQRRESEGYVGTGSSWCRELGTGGAIHRDRRWLRRGGRASAVLAVFAALTLLACSDDSPSTITDELKRNAETFEYTIGVPDGSLTLATVSEPLTLNLALANDAGSSSILGYLFEGLTETSWLTDEVQPALAESWKRSENGFVWTFYLREDVTWHDGESFTAHDVDFTFNDIIYNDDIDASARATFNFRSLDEETGVWTEEKMTVTALDDYTVRCVLPVPFAPFLRSMGTAIYPKHILEPYVNNGTFASAWDIKTDPTKIFGTGPFTIKSYGPGERVVLQRNLDYWLEDGHGGPLPYLAEVTYLIVPDQGAGLGKFWTGESDVLGVLGEWHAGLKALQAIQNFTIYRRGPTFGTTFLGFNMNPNAVAPEKLNWFSNKNFRQAVAHSVDKDMIINDIKNGFGYPQWASISPAAGDFHNPNVRRYEYDIGEANAILDGLGWRDTDGDGVREDAAGNRIEFSLLISENADTLARMTNLIRDGLADIGVQANVNAVEWGDLVSRLTDSYDWETTVVGFTGGTDPHGGIELWHSSENLHLWYPNQPQPATGWQAQIDDLYVRASQELERATRVDLYHQAQEIAAENVPVIFTTLPERLAAVRNVFGNTTPTLYGLWDIRYLYRTD